MRRYAAFVLACRSRLVTAMTLVVASLTHGCTGKLAPMTKTEFRVEAAVIRCEEARRRRPATTSADATSTNGMTATLQALGCDIYRAASPTMFSMIFGADYPMTEFDPVTGAACLAALRAMPSNCVYDVATRSLCSRAIVGTVPEGGSCTVGSQCAGHEGLTDCVEGTCVLAQRGRLGDRCIHSFSRLLFFGTGLSLRGSELGTCCLSEDGLRCVDGTCQPLQPLGAACTYINDCVEDAFCNESGRCVDGKEAKSFCALVF